MHVTNRGLNNILNGEYFIFVRYKKIFYFISENDRRLSLETAQIRD